MNNWISDFINNNIVYFIILIVGIIVHMIWEMKKMEDRITYLEDELNGTNRMIENMGESNNDDQK